VLSSGSLASVASRTSALASMLDDPIGTHMCVALSHM
jgi:hypothetical protein